MDDRSKFSIRLDAVQRVVMTNTLSGTLPLYIVTEYPKSGGSWVAQMLAEVLGLPFPRNKRPKIESSIMHGHYLYTPFMSNVVVVLRDGRDVMVSQYYYSLFQNDKNSPFLVEKTRSELNFKDYDDVRNNLPKFIEYIFESKENTINPYQFTWAQFVNSWLQKEALFVKYEDLLVNPVGELEVLSEKFGKNDEGLNEELHRIVEKYSFSNQSGRNAGIENKNSFLRKGVAGDWRETFSRLSCEVFDQYAGNELIDVGYEDDRSWIDACLKVN